jgi:hypothetical protein
MSQQIANDRQHAAADQAASSSLASAVTSAVSAVTDAVAAVTHSAAPGGDKGVGVGSSDDASGDLPSCGIAAVQQGKLFNILDTLLVSSTSKVMSLDDPIVSRGHKFIHSTWFQFRVRFVSLFHDNAHSTTLCLSVSLCLSVCVFVCVSLSHSRPHSCIPATSPYRRPALTYGCSS